MILKEKKTSSMIFFVVVGVPTELCSRGQTNSMIRKT